MNHKRLFYNRKIKFKNYTLLKKQTMSLQIEQPQPIQEASQPEPQTSDPTKITSKFNILDQAKKVLITSGTSNIAKTLILLGSKKSGKTSIFNTLTSNNLSSNNDYNPTFGINYGFMRYQHSTSKKQIINIYEIGGGIENLSLLKTIINTQTLSNTLLFLVLDFEKPDSVLETFFSFTKQLKGLLTDIIDKDTIKDVIQTKENLLPKTLNKNLISIFPCNISIICNKYDIFEKIDAEKLKWAAKALRYFSLINGMDLIYHSTKDAKLTNILHATVTHFAFGKSKIENISKYVQKNELRAMYIHYFNDSFEEIGDPKVMQRGGADNMTLWKESYESLFPKKNNKKENEFDDVDNEMELEVDVDKANWEIYKESRIDNEMKMFENAKMNEKERINTKGEVGSKLKMKNKKK